LSPVNLVGTQKPVPVNQPDDFVVTLGQLDWRNLGDTLKARQAGHPASMNPASDNQTTRGFAHAGKSPSKPISGNGRPSSAHGTMVAAKF
jgi:hypothetical protein